MNLTPSVIIHVLQGVLSPLSVWLAFKDGIIAGMLILAFIGLLHSIDIWLTNRNKTEG